MKIENSLINISIKSLFILVFLTIFFFAYTKDIVKKNLEGVILNMYNKAVKTNNSQTPSLLDMFNNYFKSNIEINANEIKDQTEATTNNNNILFTISIMMIVFFSILIVLLMTLFNTVCVKNILLTRIIILNICVYSIIGFVEILFFNTIALKYIPINESEIIEVITSLFT